MKHIVFVIGNYKNGGVPMRATNLANEFGRRGYKSTILVTKDIAENIFFELHENVELISLKQFVAENQNNKLLIKDLAKHEKDIKVLKSIRYISKFIKCWDKSLEKRIRAIRKGSLLRQYLLLNQDAILIPFGLDYYEQCYYASQGLNFKIVYAERNAAEVEVPTNAERAAELLQILSKADGAIFQTKDEQAFYEQYINKNTAVIHNPIKKNLPQPYVGERRKVIVNYCRISQQKNLKLLVDAFAKLNKQFPDYQLEIYGNAVEESEEKLCLDLKLYIKEIDIEHCVKVLPPVADVHEKVKDCAMFVSSSDFEGLSNSMIEAMAIGLPCVCTDCLGGGAREVIQNEKSGLIVPMKDVEALCGGMKRMIEEPELARRCGEKATIIREEQAVEHVVDMWIKIIESV